MNITIIEFIILGLATWRLSNLFVYEDGPFDIFGKIRYIIGVRYDERSSPFGTNVIASGLSCVWCTSMWIGIIITIFYVAASNVAVFISLPFALSGVASIIEMYRVGE
jgi:hypothetical protein